jgi:hypothetical protein
MAYQFNQRERTHNLPVYPIFSCPVCKYPIQGPTHIGEQVHCPSCSSDFIAQDVSIPGWLVGSLIGLGIGIFLGPSILASTEAGSQWLAKKARERMK